MSNSTVDVYQYDKLYQSIENVSIVSGVTAWYDLDTGTAWLLIFNESLFYRDKLDHMLITPIKFAITIWNTGTILLILNMACL